MMLAVYDRARRSTSPLAGEVGAKRREGVSWASLRELPPPTPPPQAGGSTPPARRHPRFSRTPISLAPDPRGLLAAPAILYMSLMFVLPLGLLLTRSLFGADGFTLKGYAPRVRRSLLRAGDF